MTTGIPVGIAGFVWTFHGVMEAIALGVVLLGFALVGLLVACVKVLEWWERRKKNRLNAAKKEE